MRSFIPPLALAVVLMLAACSAPEPATEPPPPEVEVVTLRKTRAPFQLELAGRLAPYRSADVRARVAGVVRERAYREGSQVERGQLLFQIDPAPLRAALAEAEAARAQAQAAHANARVAADRARRLAPTRYLAQADVDDALAAERSAAAALQAAQAAVQSARINLGYASVTAPIAGQSNRALVTEGALVGQGAATLLTTIDQLDPLYANFSLGSVELDRIRSRRSAAAGDMVQVILHDGALYPHAGRLDFTSDVVDPATGAVSMRAILPNPDRRLRPGAYVTLKATLGEQDGVFLVPQAAVQRDAASAYVLLVGDDAMVIRRNIVTGRALGNDWVVEQGLEPGERVIVGGVQKAMPETRVKPIDRRPPAADADPTQTATSPAASRAGG